LLAPEDLGGGAGVGAGADGAGPRVCSRANCLMVWQTVVMPRV